MKNLCRKHASMLGGKWFGIISSGKIPIQGKHPEKSPAVSKKQVMGRDANRSWEKKTALLCAGKARRAAGVEE
jgi:hypothetical protein